MSKRWINGAISVVAIIVGCVIYVFLRSGTWIAKIFDSIPVVMRGKVLFDGYPLKFLRYYFPDFLWGLSLATALYAVNAQGNLYFSAVLAICCGGLWEMLQFFGVVSGTGDLLDLALYILAGISAYLINQRREKK